MNYIFYTRTLITTRLFIVICRSRLSRGQNRTRASISPPPPQLLEGGAASGLALPQHLPPVLLLVHPGPGGEGATPLDRHRQHRQVQLAHLPRQHQNLHTAEERELFWK